MTLPVPLQEVVDAVEPLSDEWEAYVNRKTGQVVAFVGYVGDEAMDPSPESGDWLLDMAPDVRAARTSEDFIALPGAWDFDEYRVMQQFCRSLENGALAERLLGALRGRGAFRRFKDALHNEGVADEWYEFRDGALRQLVVDFLEEQEIPYSTT